MAVLNASKGRIIFLPATANRALQMFRRVQTRHFHGSFSRAIATMALPNCASAVLTAPIGRSGFSSRASMKQPHHFSAPRRRQLENGQIDAGSNGCGAWQSAAGNSAAGDAHVPADARAVVPAVDDEVVAFRLEDDGAIDGGAQKIIVRGRPKRFAQI